MSRRGRILVVVHMEECGVVRIISAQRATNHERRFYEELKKAKNKPPDEMLPEYDFYSMKGGVRGKYAKRYHAGTNIVLLDPEVAKAFPTEAEVNEALRAMMSIRKIRSTGGAVTSAAPSKKVVAR